MLISSALVIAGDGTGPWVRSYQSRTSAAAPETAGAACDVPETIEYRVVPAKNLLHTPVATVSHRAAARRR